MGDKYEKTEESGSAKVDKPSTPPPQNRKDACERSLPKDSYEYLSSCVDGHIVDKRVATNYFCRLNSDDRYEEWSTTTITTIVEPKTCDDGYPDYRESFNVDKSSGSRSNEKSEKKRKKEKDWENDPTKAAEDKFKTAEAASNKQK